jgi:hypothetical protein
MKNSAKNCALFKNCTQNRRNAQFVLDAISEPIDILGVDFLCAWFVRKLAVPA